MKELYEALGLSPPEIKTRTPDAILEDAARRHGLENELPYLRRLMQAESGGDPQAKSPKGASGLMQLMPDTAAMLGVEDIFDPEQNVDGGVRYYKQMLERYGGDQRLAAAAYNAGPENVDKHGGIPPFKETQDFVNKVAGSSNVSDWTEEDFAKFRAALKSPEGLSAMTEEDFTRLRKALTQVDKPGELPKTPELPQLMGQGPLTVADTLEAQEAKWAKRQAEKTALREPALSPDSVLGGMAGGYLLSNPAAGTAIASMLRAGLGTAMGAGTGDVLRTYLPGTAGAVAGVATELATGLGVEIVMQKAGRYATPKAGKYLAAHLNPSRFGQISAEEAELFTRAVANQRATQIPGFNPTLGPVVHQPRLKIRVPSPLGEVGDFVKRAPIQEAHLELRRQIRAIKRMGGNPDIAGPRILDEGTGFTRLKAGDEYIKDRVGTLETTSSIFTRAENKYPGITDTLLTPLRNAKARVHDRQLAFQEELNEIRKSFSNPRKSSLRIGKWLINEQPDGPPIIAAMGATVEPLSPQEMQTALKIRDELRENWFPAYNKARVLAGQQPIQPRENYFTLSRVIEQVKDEGLNPLTLSEDVILDRAMRLGSPGSGAAAKTPWFPWSKKRVESDLPVSFDAFGIYERYGKAAIDFIETAPEVAKIHMFVNGFKTDPELPLKFRGIKLPEPSAVDPHRPAMKVAGPSSPWSPTEAGPPSEFPWLQLSGKDARESATVLEEGAALDEYLLQSPQGYRALTHTLGKEESVLEALRGETPRFGPDVPLQVDPGVRVRTPFAPTEPRGRPVPLDVPPEEAAVPPYTPPLRELAKTAKGKQPKGEGFGQLAHEAPNLANYLMDLANKAVGVKPPPVFGKIDKVFKDASYNTSLALLGGNMRTVLVQPFALVGSGSEVGVGNTLWGIADAFNPQKMKFAFEHSKVLSQRSFDIVREELLDKAIDSGLKNTKDDLNRASLWFTQWMDTKTASAGWWSGFRKALNDGQNFDDAVKYADEITVAWHASPAAIERAAVQSGDLGKGLSALQTFVIAEYSSLCRRLFGIRNPGVPTEEAVKRLMKYIILATAANEFYQAIGMRSPGAEPIHSWQEAREKGATRLGAATEVAKDVMPHLPFFGSLAYGRMHPAIDPIAELIGGGGTPGSMIEAAAKLRGVPFTTPASRLLQTESGYNLRDFLADKTGLETLFAPSGNVIPMSRKEAFIGKSGEDRLYPINWRDRFIEDLE